MKLTELLLTHRQEAELQFVTALLKCKALDDALSEHAAILAAQAGLKTIDPLANAAWDGLTRKAPPSDVVWVLHQLGLRKASISDLVRVVQETGASDPAVILAALDKKGGSPSNN